MKFRILNFTLLLLSFGLTVMISPVVSQQLSQFRPADSRLFEDSFRSRQASGFRCHPNVFVSQRPPMTALIPNKGGVTVKAYPSFFIFVPQLSETAKDISAEFFIQDQHKNVIYETVIQPPQQASILQIDLPQTEASKGLEINQTYQWYFIVFSGEIGYTVLGVIQRVQPSAEFVQSLKSNTSQQQLENYQEAGIWYETLSTLAELRQTEPDNIEFINQWNQLLKLIGLEYIQDIPFAKKVFNFQKDSKLKKSSYSQYRLICG